MRCFGLALLALFCVATLNAQSDPSKTPAKESQPPAKNAAAPAVATEQPTPAALSPADKALTLRLAEISFSDAPFDQAIGQLGTLAQCNIGVRWNRLESQGIERDKPLTLQVRDLTLGRVLELMLDQIANDSDLVFVADDDLILISSAEDFGRKMSMRMYSVKRILQTIPYFRRLGDSEDGVGSYSDPNPGQGGQTSPPTNILDAEQQVKRPLLNSFMYLEEEDRQQEYDKLQKDPERMMLDLVNTITATIEPNSWVANGGKGTITPFRGVLIVNNNLLVQQKIDQMLKELTTLTVGD